MSSFPHYESYQPDVLEFTVKTPQPATTEKDSERLRHFTQALIILQLTHSLHTEIYCRIDRKFYIYSTMQYTAFTNVVFPLKMSYGFTEHT